MPALRKEITNQRILKIIIPPAMDEALQELKAETGLLVAEHVRQAINLYLTFREPGRGIDMAAIYNLALKAKEAKSDR